MASILRVVRQRAKRRQRQKRRRIIFMSCLLLLVGLFLCLELQDALYTTEQPQAKGSTFNSVKTTDKVWITRENEPIRPEQEEGTKVASTSTLRSSSSKEPTTPSSSLCDSQSMKFQQLCSGSTLKTTNITVQMLAIPHSASSSTQLALKPRHIAWSRAQNNNNKTLINGGQHGHRGFACPGGIVMGYSSDCQDSTNQESQESWTEPKDDDIVSCLLGQLHLHAKSHWNYNKLVQNHPNRKFFTILRDPKQLVLSHYRHRHIWDKQWDVEYPPQNSTSRIISSTEWARRAWWRHNLMTKALAIDTQLLWLTALTNISTVEDLTQSKSDAENRLGKESTWLQTATTRLAGMPFFGLFHRLGESFELIGFHLCVPVQEAQHKASTQVRDVDASLEAVMDQYFRLDSLLLQEAEQMFNVLVEDMRQKKERGILCDLGSVLQEPQHSIGLQCIAANSTMNDA